MKHARVLLAVALVSAVNPCIAQSNTEPIKVGNQVQLFLDNYVIESSNGVELMLQKPQPAGVAIKFDRPWEGHTSA